MKIRRVFLFILMTVVYGRVTANVVESNGTGGGVWTISTSWLGDVVPVDGDTVIVQAGDTITIDDVLFFDGVIQVYGVLLFDNGKLSMDENSVIQLAEGSNIIALGSPQNNSISIGNIGNRITTIDINDLDTPNQLTEDTLTSGGCAANPTLCDANPLPVEILYFSAARVGKGVQLSWATVREENFDYFTVERAPDGEQFHSLGQIFSETGFSDSKLEYAFYDEMPLSGYSFYRLKTTDFDGYTEYHGVVSVRMDNVIEKIRIFPNPVHGNAVQVNFAGEKETSFQLVSFTGQIIQKGILSQGINEIHFIRPLEAGIYFIQLEESGLASPMKLIIR
jgi:hypothetical protein